MIDTGPFVRTLQDKPVAVFGLGISGLSVVKALKAGGADVLAFDDSAEKCAAAESLGARIVNFQTGDLKECAGLILSPGVPLDHPAPHPVVEKARAAGIEIIGDLEILHRCMHGRKTIGITGTNGKSTTTALIQHILLENGVEAVAGGNIGLPVLDLDLPGMDGVLVLEISSYQMELCPNFRPEISILLNITPDHLDRHGSIEGYAAAKAKIMGGSGIAICGIDDAPSLAVFEGLKDNPQRKAFALSLKKEVADGVFVRDGVLFEASHGNVTERGAISAFPGLPGVHNQQNAAAAYLVARLCGVSVEGIFESFKTYPGLPHRQHLVRVINGVAYINDSKATNAEAAAKAIACYKNIYLIAGGRMKEGGLKGLEPLIDRIRHAFVIGEAMEDFARWFEKSGVEVSHSGSLDVAVLEAHKVAQAERGEPGGAGTVLLSPACASWDQFRNFEHRGDVFESLVQSLEEDVQI